MTDLGERLCIPEGCPMLDVNGGVLGKLAERRPQSTGKQKKRMSVQSSLVK